MTRLAVFLLFLITLNTSLRCCWWACFACLIDPLVFISLAALKGFEVWEDNMTSHMCVWDDTQSFVLFCDAWISFLACYSFISVDCLCPSHSFPFTFLFCPHIHAFTWVSSVALLTLASLGRSGLALVPSVPMWSLSTLILLESCWVFCTVLISAL